MEFVNFTRAEEAKLINLDYPEKISPSFLNGRPKSSLSINQAGLKEMSLLSPYDTNRRHFSASFVYDKIKSDSQFLDRLRNSYASAKSLIKIYPETVTLPKKIGLQQTKINIEEPSPTNKSRFSETLDRLKNTEIEEINLLDFIFSVMSSDELKLLIEMENGNVPERNGILFPDSETRFKNLAFTWAAFRDLAHLLPKLEASGAYINNTFFDGTNAVMVASFGGSISSLKYLIERNVDLNCIHPLNNRTCLHLTVSGNSYEAAKLLLDNGCKLNHPGKCMSNPLLHYAIRAKAESLVELFLERGADPTGKNALGETPLHIACSVYSYNCCEMLLQNSNVDVNAKDAMDRTPLHCATISSKCDFRIIELLFKHGASVNLIDKNGFSPLHIACLNENSKVSEILIWNGADVSCRTSKGVSALNIILRKIPESLEVLRVKLDSSIKLNRPGCQNREIEMSLDFSTILPSGKQAESSIINTFIVENRKDFLSHPLVMAFLYLKWKKIGRIYILNIFLHALADIFMTLYVLTALAFKCYNNNKPSNHFICSYSSKRTIEFEWYMWMILTWFTLPRKLLSFIMNRCITQFIWSVENLLDFVVLISVFITSFVFTGQNYDWQNYVGAFAIISAWANLMLMIGQLPTFGTYVTMFTQIQFEFAKLLFAYSGLLIGFTLSFCVIYTKEPSFRNPLTALVKILAMMAGELDFEGLINQSHLSDNYSNSAFHPLSVCAQILFSIFIIFIAVILMNLLVGIAVHDIQGLRKHAGVTKLVRQTKLILYTEMVHCKIPFFLQKWMPKHDMRTLKCILVVKPLNPLEKSIPKDILQAAFQIAQKSNPVMDTVCTDFDKKRPWMQESFEEHLQPNFESAVETLTLQMKTVADEIHEIRDQFQDLKQILESILSKLS